MLDSDTVYEKYSQPFRLLEELGIKCGYEKSFKLTPRHLLRNRYLLGIATSELEESRLSRIQQRMEMPERFVSECSNRLADANLVLLGFEEGVQDCVYKIYLEYWDKILAGIESSAPPYSPQTMFLGYKWSAFDNSRSAITDYVYYPRIKLDEILARLQALMESSADSGSFDATREIITQSAKRADPESFIYLEASEADNPRKSFDINLYRAGIELSNIYPLLARLCQNYAISADHLDELFARVGSRLLGHLSGGIDREGNSFFTVYYDAEATRQ
jgi:hypothetical protein